MEMFDWQVLPRAGGLLDQDEQEMDDLLTISLVKAWLQPPSQAELEKKFT